jgi:pSer/pThr/pTyr-binding forkhead associated (FHA) protein
MWILKTKPPEDDQEGLTFRLRAGAMKTLGRATRADFIVDEALVSRLHCRFTAGGAETLEVEDLGSTNGTFVNGRRVKKAALAAGDTVRVGRVDIEISEAPN